MTVTKKWMGLTYEYPSECPSCKFTKFTRPRTWESKLQDLVTARGAAKIVAAVGRVFASPGNIAGKLARCEKCRKPVLACPHCHQEFHPPGELPPDSSKRVCMKCDETIGVSHYAPDDFALMTKSIERSA